MNKNMLVGIGRLALSLPPAIWHKLEGGGAGGDPLAFMSADHHRVRDFAVQELIQNGVPLPPERFARALNLSLERVRQVLDDLEHHKTFLFRSDGETVSWAYPVTVEPTPHRVRFSSGEQVYAA
jgi:hypothetical protein